MSKMFQVSTLSTMELGGGTIKRRKTCALLLALSIAMFIVPSAGGTTDQSASDNNAKIGLNEKKNVLEVNAASKKKKSVKKTSKKVKTKSTKKKSKKAKKSKKKSKKKVKAAYTYKTSTYYYSTSTVSWSSYPQLESIIKEGSKFGYSSAHHTGAELERYGSGDCWAMSDWLNTKIQNAGYTSRIITYATSYSSQHKSVQVCINGEWHTIPYRSYGYHYLFT